MRSLDHPPPPSSLCPADADHLQEHEHGLEKIQNLQADLQGRTLADASAGSSEDEGVLSWNLEPRRAEE